MKHGHDLRAAVQQVDEGGRGEGGRGGGGGEHVGMLSKVEFMCRAIRGGSLFVFVFFNSLGVVLCRLVPKELIIFYSSNTHEDIPGFGCYLMQTAHCDITNSTHFFCHSSPREHKVAHSLPKVADVLHPRYRYCKYSSVPQSTV